MMRIALFCVIVGILAVPAMAQKQVLPDNPAAVMPMERLVELLIPMLGLETQLEANLSAFAGIPLGTNPGLMHPLEAYKEKFTPDKTYLVECMVLIKNGFPIFFGTLREQCVTRGLLAEVLFDLVSAKLNLKAQTTEEKLFLLAERGLLPNGRITDCLTNADIMTALNQPILNESISAYFGQPMFMGTKPFDPVHDPFGSYRIKNVTEQAMSPMHPWLNK